MNFVLILQIIVVNLSISVSDGSSRLNPIGLLLIDSAERPLSHSDIVSRGDRVWIHWDALANRLIATFC